MNELLTQYSEIFSVERKRKVKEGGEKEEGGEVEGKVSYSVSGDLQIT